MQKIFEGKVYDIIPRNEGIIFSYQKAVVDEGEIVCFKMISIENSIMTDISKNIYWNEKFGSNYLSAIEYCENFVTANAVLLPANRLFLCNESGQSFVVDSNGEVGAAGEIKHRGMPPKNIALYKNCLWASFENSNVLLRFNINTLRQELRIGGKSSPFNKPSGIFVEGDNAFVCNSGSNSIVKINLENYSFEEYSTFNEPVYDYVKVSKYEFVLLESGLYVM